MQPHRRLVKEGTLTLEKVVKRSVKQRSVYLKELDVQKDALLFLFNDILLQCKHVPPDSYELQRMVRLSSGSIASVVVHEWMASAQTIVSGGGGASDDGVVTEGKTLLRILDEEFILYFSSISDSTEDVRCYCNGWLI